MKTINYLSILFLGIIVMACNDKMVNQSNNSELQTADDHQNSIQKIEFPSPDNHLFGDVEQSIKDTVLKRLSLDIEYKNRLAEKSTAVTQSQLAALRSSAPKFIPVIKKSPTPWLEKTDKIFQVDKEKACFYIENENGETTYYIAKYTDRSNFTKDTNPQMYELNKKIYGEAKADSLVNSVRNTPVIDRWKIVNSNQGVILLQLFEYARSQADNGFIFLLTSRKHYFEICFFKDNKPFSCNKTSLNAPISVREVSIY